LDKLPNQNETIGISYGKILLNTKNDDYSKGIIIQVPVIIEALIFEVIYYLNQNYILFFLFIFIRI